MFSKPRAGRTTLSLPGFSDSASDLTDIPNDMLDALINYYRNNVPLVVKFDAEGSDYILISDCTSTYIIRQKAEAEFIEIENFSIYKLTRHFLVDIERDFDDWCLWLLYVGDDLAQYQYELKTKLSMLRGFFAAQK